MFKTAARNAQKRGNSVWDTRPTKINGSGKRKKGKKKPKASLDAANTGQVRRKKPLPGISKRRDAPDVVARKAAEDRLRLVESGVKVTVLDRLISSNR
ncbi:hypothetical protein [Pseudorhodoplanes sp.]|uniref:hypothetical protein n=1 Tax=Pseudorhodoplanes sp. TaxID=1934341 RepID=UPI00391AB933